MFFFKASWKQVFGRPGLTYTTFCIISHVDYVAMIDCLFKKRRDLNFVYIHHCLISDVLIPVHLKWKPENELCITYGNLPSYYKDL